MDGLHRGVNLSDHLCSRLGVTWFCADSCLSVTSPQMVSITPHCTQGRKPGKDLLPGPPSLREVIPPASSLSFMMNTDKIDLILLLFLFLLYSYVCYFVENIFGRSECVSSMDVVAILYGDEAIYHVSMHD